MDQPLVDGFVSADEVYQFALRRVTGEGGARNWNEALRLFGEAAVRGSADGARAYASLLALGTASPPNWGEAMASVKRFSAGNDPARRQLDLLRRMPLGAEGQPTVSVTTTTLSTSPLLALVQRLLSPAECEHVRKLATPLLQPSVVVDPRTGRLQPNPVRTSLGAVLGPVQQDLVVHAINRRIAAVTETDIEQGEPLTVLRYTMDQEYRLHHDCLPNEANQRVMTVIVYLTDQYAGGATAFEGFGKTLRPNAGDAVVFCNTLPDGRPDLRTRHAGLPVTEGVKWIATRWIRRSTFDPWGLYHLRGSRC